MHVLARACKIPPAAEIFASKYPAVPVRDWEKH
jgi:hypothetical protein